MCSLHTSGQTVRLLKERGREKGRGKKVKIVYSAKILRFFFQSQKIDDVEKKNKAVFSAPSSLRLKVHQEI